MEKKKFSYIEVRSYKNNTPVKRVDVTGRTSRSIDNIENGMNRNMNHEQFYTFSFDSEKELKAF